MRTRIKKFSSRCARSLQAALSTSSTSCFSCDRPISTLYSAVIVAMGNKRTKSRHNQSRKRIFHGNCHGLSDTRSEDEPSLAEPDVVNFENKEMPAGEPGLIGDTETNDDEEASFPENRSSSEDSEDEETSFPENSSSSEESDDEEASFPENSSSSEDNDDEDACFPENSSSSEESDDEEASFPENSSSSEDSDDEEVTPDNLIFGFAQLQKLLDLSATCKSRADGNLVVVVSDTTGIDLV